MNLVWSYSIEDIDWEELVSLYRAAPLGSKNAVDLKIAFTNSMFKYFIREDSRLIGVGRALADGRDCSYICDVALMPSHQGIGLGKAIVSKLIDLSLGHRKIILYAAPGKEGFYNKLGFRRMNTAMAIFENPALAVEQGYTTET